MSQSQYPGYGDGIDTFDEEEFVEEIETTFASWMKSAQALDAQGIPLSKRDKNDLRRHYDGEAMIRHFGMRPFWKVIESAERASKYDDGDRTFAEFPSAFLHLVLHLTPFERRQIRGTPEPGFFERMPDTRAKVLRWFAEDTERLKRKRPGGTDVLFHGEQGTTKTTAMLWCAAVMMQINNEDIVWMASEDACEWLSMAPYATVCLPSGVDVEARAAPDHPDAPDTIQVGLDAISRDVIRYDDPTDLLSQLSSRTPGQFYAVYPDPNFRKCESITGHSYHPLSEVDESKQATSMWHWTFALFEQRIHGQEHNRLMTIMADELHKFMHSGAEKGEHDSWTKISDWGSAYGDARKHGLSAFFGTHEYVEIHPKALAKIRWGCTMNGEEFPNKAPVSGDLRNLNLGQGTFWNKTTWAPLQWPDMKSVYTSDADIKIVYPRWRAAKESKSS